MRRLTVVSLAVLCWGGMLLNSASAQTQAQTQQVSQPLGDYARTLRKDKGQAAAKKFDNDNLPMNDKLSVVGQATDSNSDLASPEMAKAPEAAPATDAAKAAATDGQPQAPPTAGTDPESMGKPSAPPAAAAAQPASQGAGNSDVAKADPATTKKSDSKADADAQQRANEAWQKKIADQKDRIDLISRDLDVTQREYHLRAAAFVADAGNRLRNSGTWDQEDAKYKQQITDKQKELEDAKQKLDDMQEEARKSGVPSSQRE